MRPLELECRIQVGKLKSELSICKAQRSGIRVWREEELDFVATSLVIDGSITGKYSLVMPT